MLEGVKNNFPVFPDLHRLQLANRAVAAPTIAEREHANALLTLYDTGKISVFNDPTSGELMVHLSELN
tara:strand:+ start:144 stop:347 length:204 start_codon:yes stop_codon:yes gene_type:complete